MHSTSTTHPKIYIGNPAIAGEQLRLSYDNSLSQAYIRSGGEPSGTFKPLYIDASITTFGENSNGSVVFGPNGNGTNVNFTQQPIIGGYFMPFTRLFYNTSSTAVGNNISEASGNWTVPTGVYRIWYELYGSGAGGGCSGSQVLGGSGAGAGGVTMGFLYVTPGDSIAISIGILTYSLSRGILGGVMRSRILYLVWALVAQYITDYTFLYQAGTETYYNAGIVDLMYTISLTIMALGVISFSYTYDTNELMSTSTKIS